MTKNEPGSVDYQRFAIGNLYPGFAPHHADRRGTFCLGGG